MKKLKLNFEMFSQAETLSRTHMRSVLGGNSVSETTGSSTSVSCQFHGDCPEGQYCHYSSEGGKKGVCGA